MLLGPRLHRHAPLYKILHNRKDYYAYDDTEKEKVMSQLGDIKKLVCPLIRTPPALAELSPPCGRGRPLSLSLISLHASIHR